MEIQASSMVPANLRFLTWEEMKKQRIFTQGKADILSGILKISVDRAQNLLDGTATLKGKERTTICHKFFLEEEIFNYQALVGNLKPAEIMRDNVLFLMKSLIRGQQKELSLFAQVDQQTVNRWARGKNLPTGEHLRKFQDFMDEQFGHGYCANLKYNPLFLDDWPLTKKRKVQCLKDKLDRLSSEELSKLYPVLIKILN